MISALSAAAKWVGEAQSVVVLSGAGMSAESGVPTFRDAQTGLWQRFEPEHLATEDAFRTNTSMVWTWYVWRAMLVNSVEANAGHKAIASWQSYLAANHGQLTVATQNVDDLHERGGANNVLHLHGSLHNYRCLECHTPAHFDPTSTGVTADQQFDENNVLDAVKCQHCELGVLRPGVVWFGEMLPQDTFDAAIQALKTADLVVVVGTSGLVQPAASLPHIAQDGGTRLMEINPVPTQLSDVADIYLEATAATALPGLLSSILD